MNGVIQAKIVIFATSNPKKSEVVTVLMISFLKHSSLCNTSIKKPAKTA
jgi:hypothetical protein